MISLTRLSLAAQKRRVKLTNLPPTSSLSFIQSFVWGGLIERFDYKPGSTTAWVQFQKHDNCMAYFEATANGIDVPGEDRVIWVELDPDVTIVNEFTQGLIDINTTRCVRAVGVEEDWTMDSLTRLAAARNRKVERIINGQNQHKVCCCKALCVPAANRLHISAVL